MATATPSTITEPSAVIAHPSPADIVKRYVKRVLPVDLTDDELLKIAREAAKKRRVLRQLENDLADEVKQRKQRIAELEKEITTHDRELDTEQQERVVICDEIFRSGLVYTRRSDTGEEFEPRPATALEAQRFLPAVESTLHTLPSDRAAPLLDQAAAAQAVAGANDAPGGVASDEEAAGANDPGSDDDAPPDDEDAEEPEDDGLTERTPAQAAVRDAAVNREARRKAGGKRGAKGKAK
jgi:hypothetical protein